MRPWFSGRHFSRCGTLGCTMRILMSGTVACGSDSQADLAEQGHGGERHQGHGKRRSAHGADRRCPAGASLHSTGGSAKTRTAASVSP